MQAVPLRILPCEAGEGDHAKHGGGGGSPSRLMNLLAIDTAANLCAACVWDIAAGVERGRSVADLGKGHAEHLMATIDEALSASGLSYAGIGALAVSVGPGSFTGVRVGVATARGLALALKIPATGVSTLEALAAETRFMHPGRPVLVAIEAGRGDFYAAVYDEFGSVRYAPAVVSFDEALALAQETRPALAGTAAGKLSTIPGDLPLGPLAATADIATYARIAAQRGPGAEKPRPLYLRAPDAKPQAGFVLPRTGR